MTPPILMITQGPPAWGSSRIRAWWLEQAAPDLVEVARAQQQLSFEGRRMVVFQKRHGLEDVMLARQAKERGLSVVFDVTDPLWWFNPGGVQQMFEIADVVTVSSPGLLDTVSNIPVVKKAVLIPDRMLASFHPTVKEHAAHNPTVLLWFGIAMNRVSLAGALPILGYLASMQIPLVLRVMDEMTGVPLGLNDANYPIEYVPWTLETFHANLLEADIALLPPYPGPWGFMKSNNKAVSAWWAGLPTTDGFSPEALAALVTDPSERARQGRENRALAEADYNITQSATEWRQLMESLEAEA